MSLNILRVILLLGILYVFIVSLDLLSSAFRLCLGVYKQISSRIIKMLIVNFFIVYLLIGIEASTIVRESTQNPIAGLVIGILITVVVQSSSTSTSIVVAMVGSKTNGMHDF